MMSKLIALDDGHGMQTAGKRTPTLPNGEVSELGENFMHENEFNRAVVKYLDIELRRCGFKTILVAPTDSDTPLSTRVKTANNNKADLYISIHANANTSEWGSWGGIETYYYPNSSSLKVATLLHNQLMKNNPLRDRGLKEGTWLYVIKNTNMTALLFELGFMDSNTDYKYLLSDSYRKQCAIDICKGICEHYGVKYVAEVTASSTNKTIAYETRRQGKVIKDTYTHNKPDFETESRVKALKVGEVYWVYGEYQEMYILGGSQYVYKKHITLI